MVDEKVCLRRLKVWICNINKVAIDPMGLELQTVQQKEYPLSPIGNSTKDAG